jgi:tRNA A-37 threonylcarbamoyl transferase component Bud32
MIPDQSVAPLLTSDDRIDEICDAYEVEWRAGERPHIAAVLDRSGDAERPALFCELLLLEIEYRRNLGELPSRADYLAKFPEFAEYIEAIGFKHGLDAGLNSGAESANNNSTFSAARGARIAQFELLELLGTGAAGEVWKARDTRLQRTVAIKFPRSQNLSEAELHRFLREGRAAAQLHHPSIVPVHEVGRDGDTAFIVSEHIAGENLRDRLSRGNLPLKAAAELCAKLAEALHHAHEHGIVHRDLKPANILVDDNNEPHITDFGLAKWINDARDLTLEGQLLGTVAYMAPEQARGNVARVDSRTDVYALGAILYELLVGKCPFQGDEAAVINAILNQEPAAPRSTNRRIPRDLETICLKAIDEDPNRRYQSVQEMAVDLRRYLRGEPVFARRIGLIGKAWRWCRRRPAAAAVILLAFSVTAAALAIASLKQENYSLQGYRNVEIDSEPSGARVALVPIDGRTGEPNTDTSSVLLPGGLTPLRIAMKPGDYFVEAVLPHEAEPSDFAEIHRTVVPKGVLSKRQMQLNRDRGDDEELVRINVMIRHASDVLKGMIAVPIAEKYRKRNPLLPKVLFVDSKETRPPNNPSGSAGSHPTDSVNETGGIAITFADAKRLAELSGKRLPSALESDAILEYAREHRSSDTSGSAAIDPVLLSGLPAWTTSKYEFVGLGSSAALNALREMYVLKGNGEPGELSGLMRLPDGTLVASPDIELPIIGFRGVRSAAPRFLQW